MLDGMYFLFNVLVLTTVCQHMVIFPGKKKNQNIFESIIPVVS
jgi:hypothetical protein